MSSAIRVENLGKKYLIFHQQQTRYMALRDVISDSFVAAKRRLIKPLSNDNFLSNHEEFWALKDVSFDVKQGDRIGIIGRNGAGKSTLLKILSRITEPTTGRVALKGRVASLLEVGTGFHPELTGRENVYLNGAILGMSKQEINNKFDEIVDFSEVEKFLDTPVKRFSSGMYMRLAFAVAASLNTEILLVDEVLAVGDAEFQKKCMGKMQSIGDEGRTVLFVSHNLNAIEQLCNSCVFIERGQMRDISSDVRGVINSYLFGINDGLQNNEWQNTGQEFDNPWFKPFRFWITDKNGRPMNLPVSNNDVMYIQIEAEVLMIDPALTIGYAIYSEDGTLLYWSYQSDASEENCPKLNKGRNILRSQIPPRLLNEGVYKIELIGGLHCRQWLFQPGTNAPSVTLVIQGGLSDSLYWMAKRPGYLAPVLTWHLL